jgi:NADPH:quinone reductase-like Zn-dependent oxidoreductase
MTTASTRLISSAEITIGISADTKGMLPAKAERSSVILTPSSTMHSISPILYRLPSAIEGVDLGRLDPSAPLGGGDLLARVGSPPPPVPHIVGYLAAGTVVRVGTGVKDRTVGDRIVTLNPAGSHDTMRAVPAMSTWPIPDGLDAATAACVPVAFGTAQECLFTAGHLEAGQTALIHAGAGGVGIAAIQLAKHAGATVISTASSDEKLERLSELGLDHGINYARENFVQRARELTDGRGADVIIDSVGGQNLVDSIGALAYRGSLISVGLAGRAGSNIEARDLWERTTRCAGSSSAARCATSTPGSIR